jgi:DNA-binding transcriptional LysR family regulator
VNLATLDLNLLVVLEALLVERSATRAGMRLGLSQSAVSNALGRLRACLGDPLFVRGRGGMTPTTFALSLAGPLRASLDGLRAALGAPRAFEPSRSDYHARCAATEYGELVVLAPLACALRAKGFAGTFECKRLPGIFDLPIAALERGEIELAITHAEPIPPGKGLRAQRLARDGWALVVDRRPRAAMTLARFAASPQVKVLYAAEGPGLVGDLLRRAGFERVTPIVTAHYATVGHVVKGTDLVGILPARLAREQARALRLTLLRPPLALPPLVTTLVWHERLESSAPHAWLRDQIRRALRTGSSVRR